MSLYWPDANRDFPYKPRPSGKLQRRRRGHHVVKFLEMLARQSHQLRVAGVVAGYAGDDDLADRRLVLLAPGTKFIPRQPRAGGKPFWGCQNYPRCHSTLPMKNQAQPE